MSLRLLVPLLLETLLLYLFFICVLALSSSLHLLTVTYLRQGPRRKATYYEEDEEGVVEPRWFGSEGFNGRGGKAGSSGGIPARDTRAQAGSRELGGGGEASMTSVDGDVFRDEVPGLRGGYWSTQGESESEGDDEEEEEKEEYVSQEKVIDFSQDHGWGDGQGHIRMDVSEDALTTNADTTSADAFGISTAVSLEEGMASRRKRRRGSRDGEEQEPDDEGAGGQGS